ncbi:hypothetical protein OIT44_06535 [Weissella ceti]|uniref:Uncharacterized protein n=1 Tax=Weissella ceti TaxID=759620 RepID=A0ABT3E704_9LACO|nr:hypothetical protein [Weissella ceti]MCW0953713.1 hypothetical protein [Weissella ceti]QVK12126.1 hypothetical protein KHQ31_00180 [Weissella ceti]
MTTAGHETELFALLANQLTSALKSMDASAIIEREKYVFEPGHERVRIDLFTYAAGKTHIYAGKKDTATLKDVYRLMMYWDGLIRDEGNVDVGYLVAARHPEVVKELIDQKNALRDEHNNPIYNFELKTWQELGIPYPG